MGYSHDMRNTSLFVHISLFVEILSKKRVCYPTVQNYMGHSHDNYDNSNESLFAAADKDS